MFSLTFYNSVMEIYLKYWLELKNFLSSKLYFKNIMLSLLLSQKYLFGGLKSVPYPSNITKRLWSIYKAVFNLSLL